MEAIFFPRNDYPNKIEICQHRFGKSMTFTEQSDRILPSGSFSWISNLADTYGIKVGFFAIYTDFSDANFSNAKAAFNAGKVWFDEYSMAPSIQYKIEHYNEDHIPVTDEEFVEAYEETLLPSFLNAMGKKPVALSYAYGVQTFSDAVCPLYLGARNSWYEYHTDYGIGFGSPNNVQYSFADYKSRQSTIRWYDKALPTSAFSEGISEVASLIDTTLQNGGWLNNFTHFHSVIANGHQAIYEQYFQMLADKNANDEIYFAGYGEAVAYLVYRQLITKAVMYSPVESPNDKLVIRLEALNTISIDTDLLQVPISVKFSTAGTPLEGQNIKSNRNLISLGSGEYIVEIPYDRFPIAVIEKVSI